MLTRHRTIILIIKLLIMSELLKLNQVNLTYQTGDESIKVLKDIDLKTMKKETISFVGESGSGKTSLIMLIAGLEKATSGQIFFQNKEISSLSEDEVSEMYVVKAIEQMEQKCNNPLHHLAMAWQTRRLREALFKGVEYEQAINQDLLDTLSVDYRKSKELDIRMHHLKFYLWRT